MKNKILILLSILTVGLIIAGCTSKTTLDTTKSTTSEPTNTTTTTTSNSTTSNGPTNTTTTTVDPSTQYTVALYIDGTLWDTQAVGKNQNFALNSAEYAYDSVKNGNQAEVTLPLKITENTQLYFTNLYSKNFEAEGLKITAYKGNSKGVVFPSKLNGTAITKIGDYTSIFSDSNRNIVEKIFLPDSILTIGDEVFSEMSNLKTIRISKNLMNLGEKVFFGCEQLQAMDLKDNANFSFKDHILSDKEEQVLYKFVGEADQFIIPESFAEIVSYAFSDAKIEQLTINQSVQVIYDYAFAYANIKEVIFNADVTAIPISAFTESAGLEKIKITSETVKTIKRYAFYQCVNLSQVEYTDKVTLLERSSFEKCSSLTSIDLKNAVIQRGDVFSFSGLESFVIPSGTTEIADSMFVNWTGLKSITIPASVQKIGTNAFSGCSALVEVNIADNSQLKIIGMNAFVNCSFEKIDLEKATLLETVSEYAFLNCNKLIEFSLPSSVKKLGKNLLSGCSALEKIKLPFIGLYSYLGFKDFIDTVHQEAIDQGTTLNDLGQYWYDNTRTEDQYIKAITTTTALPTSEFLFGIIFGYDSFENATLFSQYLNETDTYSYYAPNSLKEVIIDSKYVSSYGLSGTNFTDQLILSDKVEYIGYRAIFINRKMTSIKLSENLKEIGDYAFSISDSLVKISLPDSLKIIGNFAFYYSRLLEEVKLPKADHLLLKEGVFQECVNLKSIYQDVSEKENLSIILANVTLSHNVFSKAKLIEKMILTGNIEYNTQLSSTVNPYYVCGAFSGLLGLKSLVFPEELKITYNGNYIYELPTYFFDDTPELRKINNFKEGTYNVPNEITTISNYAFSNCGLEQIILPESCTTLKDSAFAESGIVSIDVSSVTTMSSSIFSRCSKLVEVKISNTIKNLGLATFNDCISLNTLYYQGVEKEIGTALIPESVQSTDYHTFFNTAFNKVKFSEGITKIGNQSFAEVKNLKEIDIPKSVVEIGSGAFYRCSNLEKINFLGNNLRAFYDGVFVECTNLKEVIFPEGVELIGAYIFESCKSLEKVVIPSTVIEFGRVNAFAGCLNFKTLVLLPKTPTNVDAGNSNFPSMFYDFNSGKNIPNAVLKDRGVKFYVPKGSIDLYKNHSAVWYMSSNEIQYRESIGWKAYAELFEELPSGVYSDGVDTIEMSTDGSNYFVTGLGYQHQILTKNNNTYSVDGYEFTFGDKTLVLSGKKEKVLVQISNLYRDNTSQFSKNVTGALDASLPRPLQFKPQLILQNNQKARLTIFDAFIDNYSKKSAYSPIHYVGTYSMKEDQTIEVTFVKYFKYAINSLVTFETEVPYMVLKDSEIIKITIRGTDVIRLTINSIQYNFTIS